MNTIRYLIGLLVGVVILGAVVSYSKERERRLNMAFYAYQTGCYDSAKLACGHLYTEKDLYNCYDDALVYCPVNGKKFRDWIAGNNSK